MLTVNFTKSKETKGTIVFTEVEDAEGKVAIGSLYLKKDASAQLGDPTKLTVTVSA